MRNFLDTEQGNNLFGKYLKKIKGAYKWHFEIRAEYETLEISVNKLAKKHGISHTAIRKKIIQEHWEKLKKFQNSGVFEYAEKDIENTEKFDKEFQKKVSIILKHRKQLQIITQLIESAIEFDKKENISKTNQRRVNGVQLKVMVLLS